jgi:hypothetical protein
MTLKNRSSLASLLAPAVLLALTACGGDPVLDPVFSGLRAEYDALEERIFPASRTDPQNLPRIGGVYEGVLALAYYEEGERFTETAAARIKLFVDFIEDDIAGEVTLLTRAGGAPVTGVLVIRTGPIMGHDFTASLFGELVIGGNPVMLEGAMDGSFWTPTGGGEEGTFAYGNIQFSAASGAQRFGGTFAAER